MKTVFSNSELVHVYAQQTQKEGRTSNGSMFFYNNKLYSYGRHFLLAEIICPNRGVIIINDTFYSSTTRKHQSLTYSATSQYIQFFKEDIDIEIVKNRVNELKHKLSRARKPQKYISQIFTIWKKLEDWIAFDRDNLLDIPVKYRIDKRSSDYTGFKALIFALKNNSELYLDVIQKDAQKQAKIERAKKAKKLKEDLKEFRSYNKGWISSDLDYLRISRDHKFVETSQNIRIETFNALQLYNCIENGIDVKGYKLGYYTINRIDDKYLVAGCHKIPMSEIQTVGKKLLNNETQISLINS